MRPTTWHNVLHQRDQFRSRSRKDKSRFNGEDTRSLSAKPAKRKPESESSQTVTVRADGLDPDLLDSLSRKAD